MPFSIRPAHPDDASALLRLMRQALPPVVQPTTPLGPQAAHVWVRDRIEEASQNSASESTSLESTSSLRSTWASGVPSPCAYRVATTRDKTIGVAEWREIGGVLFLNSIAVDPGTRGKGAGTRLLCDGVRLGSSLGPLQLDVFEAMPDVRNWYASLGCMPIGRRIWIRFPPSTIRDRPATSETVTWQNEDDAASQHKRHGCSMLHLRVHKGENDVNPVRHTVGRIGPSLFRITNDATLRSAPVRAFLSRLNPSRHLLYLSSLVPGEAQATDSLLEASALADPLTGTQGTHLATSVRMQHTSPTQMCESSAHSSRLPTSPD